MNRQPLDIEQPSLLDAYLKRTGRIAPSENIVSQKLEGGVSNRTVLVKRPNGEDWVLKQALAQLRVQLPWFSNPKRIHREAAGLRWLGKLTSPGHLPSFLFEDTEHHLLGMTAVARPHQNWKEMLLNGDVRPEHVRQFGILLGDIHRRAYQKRAAVGPAFADRSFFDSLRIEPYYQYTATQVPEAADFLDALVYDTQKLNLTLVHGDYSPKNILVHHDMLYLLDYEVIHFGDPAFDIGFSLTHFLSKAHHLPAYGPLFEEAAGLYWRVYRRRLGDVPWLDGLETRAVRHTLACLLARVAGRSPLEYLDSEERYRQREWVNKLMEAPIATVPDLISRWVRTISIKER